MTKLVDVCALEDIPQLGARRVRRADGIEIAMFTTRHDEIVEKPLVGGRTDSALHLGKQIGDRGGEQMRRAMPIKSQRFRAVLSDDAHGRVLTKWEGQVHQLAADILKKEQRITEIMGEIKKLLGEGR